MPTAKITRGGDRENKTLQNTFSKKSGVANSPAKLLFFVFMLRLEGF